MSRLDRERRLREQLSEDWVVVRAAKGAIDLVLCRAHPTAGADCSEVRYVQVKSNARGPYDKFGPDDRETLKTLAARAGATAWLVWWPPRRGWTWIAAYDWPPNNRRADRSAG